MPLATGQVVYNRYRIVALLGQGGMGNVYRAWDINLRIPVALKENLETTSEAQKQFNEEALILARLSHPNLPRVTDYFSISGQADYLVMDYVEGKDLEMLLDELNSPLQPGGATSSTPATGLDLAQALTWVIQVCRALEYLHNQKPPVIHRDIKPANIKIRPDGRATLVDFGIAKVFDAQHSTLTGARAVTPGYSPPEQYGGSATDARSDVYALGATLYHLLTGVKPPESVQRMTGAARMSTPRLLNPALQPQVEQAILKAMAVPMDNRYQTMSDLRAALEGSLSPEQARVLAANFSAQAQPPTPTGAINPSGQATPPQGSKPAPIPVAPVPRTSTTAPPPPKGFLARSWPLLLLGGALFIVLLLVIGSLNRSASPGESSQIVLYTATPSLHVGVVNLGSSGATAPASIFTPLPKHTPTLQTSADPLATPTLPSFPAVMLEGFASKQGGWREGVQNGLDCRLERGKDRCQLESGVSISETQWVEKLTMDDSFILAVDIWLEKTNQPLSAGLVFRSSDAGRYLFTIRSDRYFRVASVQEEPSNFINLVDWKRTEAVRPGENNHLVVHGSGDTYTFFINGEYVGKLQDSLWIEGHPGIHIFSAPQPRTAIVEFDQFELRQR